MDLKRKADCKQSTKVGILISVFPKSVFIAAMLEHVGGVTQ